MSRMRTLCAAFAVLALADAAGAQPTPGGTAGKLIEHFHMQKVPQEGCWYALSYSSDDALAGVTLPARYAGRAHPAGNAIVALETARDFSALHRLTTDEVWHFYDGSPIDMLLLYPDGHGEKITLGPDVLAGQRRQFTVPRGVWQGSAPHDKAAGAYSFFADQLSPGFDYADFEIGYRDALRQLYPAYARDIERLTRAEFAVSKPTSTLPTSTLPTSTLPASTPSPDPARPAMPTTAPATPAELPPASAFSDADIFAQVASPGATLKELVGEKSPLAKTPRLSVARFTLAPGKSSGTSFNRQSQEVFVVVTGSGTVHLPPGASRVGPGSTVFIPAMQPHSIEADSNDSLVFLAISAPAFTPEDYVLVGP